MIWTWLRRHPLLLDVGLTIVVLGPTLGHMIQRFRPAAAVPLALVQCLPLVARRRHPVAVLGVTAVTTAAIAAIWPFYNPLPAGFALFTVAYACDRRTSLAAGAAALAVLAVPVWHLQEWSLGFDVVGRFAGFVVAWLIGDSLGTRGRYVGALEERAERLEREREAEAARARAEEQARIARELHDVIAHSLSVVVVQAAAANDVFESRPARAHEALRTIEETGRGALAELRRLLGAVRDPDAEYAPQPDLGRLDELLERVRASGLEVALRIEGTLQPLPVALELSAYRVVQEALTNALKHAGATRVEVALRYADGGLDVEVRDDGSGSGDGGGSGHGLIGMRERVAAFGGSLAAGPAPTGGFAVAARFPL